MTGSRAAAHPARRLLGVLFGWQKPVNLAEGEHVLREGMARRGLDGGVGWLTLTTHRLVYGRVKYTGLLAYQRLFSPHGVDVDVPLSEVTGVDLKPFWKNLRGFPQDGLEVRTGDGAAHRFSLYFARDWVAAVQAQLQRQ